MAIADTLSDMWHSLEDKAWSLADFLEDKGIPLSTFCESKGISPLLLFLGILIAIVLILALVSGGGGAAGNVLLTVTVKDTNGDAVASTDVLVDLPSGITESDRTDINGVAKIPDLPYGDVTVRISSNRYTGSATKKLSQQQESVSITAQIVTGILRVRVVDSSGGDIRTGSIEVTDLSGNSMDSAEVDGSDKYDFTLPVDTYRVVIKSSSGGSLDTKIQQVTAARAAEVTFTTSAEAADSSSVQVIVNDVNGVAVPSAQVVLYNGRNDNPLQNGQGVTDASGQITFSNIAIGTSVYPIAFVPNDKRYGQIDSYTAKNVYKRTVQSSFETIQVTLPLNGRVEVTVWDKESLTTISEALVSIKSRAGEVVGQEKLTDSEGKVVFTGFEENLEVYPVVRTEGYLDYENPNDARPVLYSGTGTKFQAMMERDGSFISSIITINAADIYGAALDGLDAVLSESGGGFIKGLANSRNVSFEVDANKNYNVAVHKSGYLRQLLEGIGPGTQGIQLEAANGANSAHVRVCTFIDVDSQRSPAASKVEFYLSTGALIDVGDTAGGTDGDNCITFIDVPISWLVYAKATTDGYPEAESNMTQAIPRQEGMTEITLTFGSGIPANAPLYGDVKVCVVDTNGNEVTGAEVLLYDADIDGPSWPGDYRLTTASDGCALFRSIPAQKTDSQGVLSTVMVYPIVSSTGRATYNGKVEGSVAEVREQATTTITVRMKQGEGICIAVKSEGSALGGVDVSLCASAQCSRILETRTTESDGHVTFSSDVTSVTVKAVANKNSYVKEVIKNFQLAQVTGGQCGALEMASVTRYATVTLDGIATNSIEAEPNVASEIKFILKVNSKPATGGSIMTGGQKKVLGADGTEVLVDMTGDINGGNLRTIDASKGKYAMAFIAPSREGDYHVTLEASILDCSSCQGDQRLLNIQVGDGDSDNDGVLDKYDLCPNTPLATVVDSHGCPVVTNKDTDGDGVLDEYDACPNTPAGVQVDSRGCPLQNVNPTQLAAQTSPATTYTDANGNGVPDIYDYPQNYQSSVQVCVVDDARQPIYDTSIILYNNGYNSYGSSGYSSGYTAPYGHGTYQYGYSGSYGYGTTYPYGSTTYPYSGTYPYGSVQPGYGYPYTTSSYPTYSTGYGVTGYGQPWQLAYQSNNCKVFVGYGSMGNLYMDTFLNSFVLRVTSNNYEPYDSVNSGRTGFSLSLGGPGGMYLVQITLKRKAGAGAIGGGDITDPARSIELVSASWKPQESSGKDSVTVYPLVTLNDRNIHVRVRYALKSAATDDLEYQVKYSLTGSRCYEISGGQTIMGGHTMQVRKGQTTVDDELTITTSDSCMANNDQGLETEFGMTVGGKLLQIGSNEARASRDFTPAKVTLRPIVGATKRISTVSDLTQLSNAMTLSNGVVTSGALPYCVPEAGNTARSRAVSTLGVVDPVAAKKKIVIEFKGTNAFPATLDDLTTKISDYIRNSIRKAPMDCKAYVTVKSTQNNMGYIEVGQRGASCFDAKVQVPGTAKTVDPWQKLFCDIIEGGMQNQIALSGSYTMKVDSK